ncbi:uncharacterized protein LOC133521797 [Cydia pomonella]|uniref:uncharacterized protein LOC133521797 n=1 Tax=Cydia pomonella TaxID=82600 RepID=UPI002ADD9B67|nr:uncharacterized protein LOC133521797 [Cydia pomonella]
MKLLLILITAACITNVSDGYWRTTTTKRPWYEFWRKPANRTNQILKYFYCRSKNFSESTIRHSGQWLEGFKRLWFVFWLGTCPERIKTTTEVPTPTTEMETTTPWPRGRSRKYPLIYHDSELDFVPKTKKPKDAPKPPTVCPPILKRPRLPF